MFDLFWELGQQRTAPEFGNFAEQAIRIVEDINGEVKALRGAVNKLRVISYFSH